MKKIKALLTASALIVSAVFSSSLSVPSYEVMAAGQVNIMPIGDSITFGLGEDGGYRKYLDYALKTKGIEFDMVGPEGKNSDSFSYNGQNCQYDGNHAGYSGFTIKQQYPIPSWGENGLLERLQSKDAVKNAQPDIVLLIIGTNDMTANRNLSDCEKDLHTLIDYILGDMPEGGVVFMGSIPEFTAYGGNAERVGNYNSTVKKVADSYGDNVQFADVHGSLNGMADMSSDNLHPSGAGYEKMGKFWAEIIEDYLENQSGGSDTPDNPEILNSDFENGLSGWKSRGSASVETTVTEASGGSASAMVSGRTDAWNGIAYSLSSKRCPADTHISVSAKIKQKTGSPVRFKMTMQYNDGGTAVYDTFAETDAASGEWVKISCADYVIPQGSDMTLYFETDTELCDFWLDDVVVMKTDGTIVPEVTEPEVTDAPAVTEPPVTTEIITPAVTEPSQEVKCDINADGKFNSEDLIYFQNWLLGAGDFEITNIKAADLSEDGILNAADFCMMKSRLLTMD